MSATPSPGESWELAINKESDIVEARSYVRKLAQDNGFDQFGLAAIVTATSELTRNIWTYAKTGIVKALVLREPGRVGIEIHFIDHGPGITDLQKVFAGGYSTGNSLGLGVSGSRRLVDEFNLETAPNTGTHIVVRKWKKSF